MNLQVVGTDPTNVRSPAQSELSSISCGREVVSYVSKKVQALYESASQPGEAQKSVQASIRSTIGIASIYFFPGTAIVAAIAGGCKPDAVKKGCQVAEGVITGFWKSLPFKAKLIVPAAGIVAVAYYDPTALFNLAGIVFSAKLGAQLGELNYRKENVAAITLQAEQENGIGE